MTRDKMPGVSHFEMTPESAKSAIETIAKWGDNVALVIPSESVVVHGNEEAQIISALNMFGFRAFVSDKILSYSDANNQVRLQELFAGVACKAPGDVPDHWSRGTIYQGKSWHSSSSLAVNKDGYVDYYIARLSLIDDKEVFRFNRKSWLSKLNSIQLVAFCLLLCGILYNLFFVVGNQ